MINYKVLCPEDYEELVKKGLTHEEIESVFSAVNNKFEKVKADGDVITPFTEKQIKDYLLQKAHEIHEPLRRAKLFNEERRLDFHLGQKKIFENQGLTKREALKASLIGTDKPVQGGRLSIDSKAKAYEGEVLGKMSNDLDKAGLREVADKGKIDREISQELFELRENGRPGISGNKMAKEIAGIIHKHRDLMVSRLNVAGAYLKRLPGYIIRQSHDRVKIRKTSFDEWKEFLIDKLDHAETFQGTDPEKFLKEAYDNIVTGKYTVMHRGGTPRTGDLAAKVSQDRVLHFKQSDGWYEYHNKYGNRKSLMQNVKSSIQQSARNTALMETFGANPRETFGKIVTDLKKESLDVKDVKQRGDFEGRKMESLEDIFDELDGTTNIVVDKWYGKIGRGVRAVQNMSKLGGATLSAIADIPFFATELNYQGVNLLIAYQKAFTSTFKGWGKTERKEIARLIGVGLDGIRGSVISRFSAQDDLLGVSATFQQKFFKWSGLEYWTDAHKMGMVLTSSNHIASQRELPFNEINKKLRIVLKQYNIDEVKWDLMRESVRKAEDGNYYITPDDIMKLNIDVVKRKIRSNFDSEAEAFKDRLATDIRTFFLDRADYAVPTPGAKEFAFMRKGTQAGTPYGEAARFLWQFKSFPITVISKVASRTKHGYKGARRGSEVVHLIIATTVMGYVAMTAKDIAKGRTPRKFGKNMATNAKILMAAFVQGGGAGIYGDFLFGSMRTRYGASPLESVLGPTYGAASDAFKILGEGLKLGLGQKDWDDVRIGDKLYRLGISNFPFANMWYTKAALDYLLLYHIQEYLNPGYLRRMEKNVEKWNNQEFIVPPRKAVKRMYK